MTLINKSLDFRQKMAYNMLMQRCTTFVQQCCVKEKTG